MNIALKEWSVVVRALVEGRQTFLLRKGGIAEGRGGFELKHREFVLFPGWEHQQLDSIQDAYHGLFEQLRPQTTTEVEITAGARVAEIREAPADIARLRQASELHVWAEPYLRMRYDYRPDLPLYVVVVRAFRLREPVRIGNDRRYKGCRSWVDLYEDVSTEGAENALDDASFEAARRSLWRALDEPVDVAVR